MKISWIENMVKLGSVSPQARDSIYRDCQQLLKVASQDGPIPIPVSIVTPEISRDKRIQMLTQQFAPQGLMLFAKALMNHQGALNDAKAMAQNRSSIADNPDYKGNTEKAFARFDEIAELAPSVAANGPVVKSLVGKRLHEGFSERDVTNLAMLQAAQMPSLKAQSKQRTMYARQISKTSAARMGEMYADVYTLGKTASIGKDASSLWNALKTTALISSVPILAGVGTGIVQKMMAQKSKEDLEKTLNNSFAQALRLSDPNTEALHANKDKARQAFKTLVHFAPHVATEPVAAKAFMSKLIEYDGVDISSIKELSEIEKNLAQVSKDPTFMQGFRSGAEATGLQKVVSGGVTEALRPTQKHIGDILAGTV